MEEKANKKPVGLIISIIFNVILIGVIVAGVICGQLFTKKTTNNNWCSSFINSVISYFPINT